MAFDGADNDNDSNSALTFFQSPYFHLVQIDHSLYIYWYRSAWYFLVIVVHMYKMGAKFFRTKVCLETSTCLSQWHLYRLARWGQDNNLARSVRVLCIAGYNTNLSLLIGSES